MTDQKQYFNFNPPGVTFNEIYSTIKSFYPLGIEKKEGSIYFEYEGLKILENLINDTIHNRETYLNKWNTIVNTLKSDFTEAITSTTAGQAPSISGYINLYATNDTYHSYSKALHFYISLLGPFYTIFGLDVTTIFDEADKFVPVERFTVVNSITVSPYNEYTAGFAKIENKLQQLYHGYKFIPYRIYSQYIKGMQVKYLDDEVCSIFNALFGRLPDHRTTRGDQLYGTKDWKQR